MANTNIITGRTRRVGVGNRNTVGNSSPANIVPANLARVVLILSCEANGFFILGDGSNNNTSGKFEQLSSMPPLVLDVETFGSLVTGNLWVLANTTAVSIDWLEIVDTTFRGELGYAGVQ